jgi:hypothetical protein
MDPTTKFAQIAVKIIKEQELVIGPLAWVEAGKVTGLSIDQSRSSVSLSGDSKDVINRLVSQYERLFGRASHEVCREAAASLLVGMPPDEIPSSLK